MRLTRFKTVRGRLLALFLAVALPVGCLTALAALSSYRTVLNAIEDAQRRTAEDFAVRTRVWYRGALRSMLTASTVLARSGADVDGCRDAASVMLKQSRGYKAFHLVTPSGQRCTTSLDPAISEADLAAVAKRLGEQPEINVWSGSDIAHARYDQVTLAGRRYLAIYAQPLAAESGFSEALLLVEPALLDIVFDLGEGGADTEVALISRHGGLVAARGSGEDNGWLPAQEKVPQLVERWSAESRSGSQRTYAARIVAPPDLYVVASFNNTAERAARLQFLILLIAPLMTLALLCIIYLRAIDRHCIRWLRNIETAARARLTQASARAEIAADMPRDIRSVAEAFNTMVGEQEVRQRKLQTALDDNRFLVRELHHRVKNSLQVVQSYIGLTKRDYRGEARLALSDAECRVHVLSAAYRFTLADGEMQPVRIDLFLDDVVTMLSNLIRQRGQWIDSRIETTASLSVDRIIPLGFLIVDVVSRALRDAPGLSVTLIVSDVDMDTIEIAIDADSAIEPGEPPKLFAGLIAQIEAVQQGTAQGKRLGAWQVSHRRRPGTA